MNIVLIGYRGCGKSAVAEVLAERTGREIVRTDKIVEERAGCPIPEYVERHGWEAFRDLEAAVVEEAGARDGVIIDTGGGAILRADNVKAVRSGGRLYWLRADAGTIRSRIADSAGRPSLTGEKSFLDEVAEVLAEREPLYAAAADVTIDTAGRSIEDVAWEILQAAQQEDV